MTEQPPKRDDDQGFEGQAGYDSGFQDGKYTNPDIAESGGVEDRAGSYEDGLRIERDDALDQALDNDGEA